MRTKLLLAALLLASCSSDDPEPAQAACEGEDCASDDDGVDGLDDADDVGGEDPRAEPDDQPLDPRADAGRPSVRDARADQPEGDAGTREGEAPSEEDAGSMTSGDPAGASCLAGSSADYLEEGPYAVKTKEVDLGGSLGPYTIFYPDPLEPDCKHPVIAWGNGTGVEGPTVYAHYFRHAASWGLVTIAAHDPNAQSQPFLASGLDYLLQGEEGELAGKLSERAGTSGHSQGGFAATSAGSHPNVVATVSVQGGGLPPPKVAFVCETGVDDFVRGPCTMSYERARGPSFLADHTAADHINTPTTLGARSEAGKEYVRIYTAWFRCFLADDASACALFEGGDAAPLCDMSDWATCGGKNFL